MTPRNKTVRYWMVIVLAFSAIFFLPLPSVILGLSSSIDTVVFFTCFVVICVCIAMIAKISWKGCPQCGYSLALRATRNEKTGEISHYAIPMPPNRCTNCGLDLTKPYKKDK